MSRDADLAFQLVVTKPQLLEVLVEYGHQRAVLLDATFGTNNLKFPLHTLAIMIAHSKVSPVARYLSSDGTAEGLKILLSAINKAAKDIRTDFEPASSHCDDAKASQVSFEKGCWKLKIPVVIKWLTQGSLAMCASAALLIPCQASVGFHCGRACRQRHPGKFEAAA